MSNQLLFSLKQSVKKVIPDSLFVKLYFYKYYGYFINLKNPITFNERLWWIHIFNRDPLTTQCTDKVKVRDYVSECGLNHILNEVYAVYDRPEDINLDDLPQEFFLKCNHLSNGNIWCKNKYDFPLEEVRPKLQKFMNMNYYWKSREWNYKHIEPKIICEKVLKDEKSKVGLVDYRFFCFEGEAKFLCVDIETTSSDGSHYSGAKRNVYDLDFNKLDIRLKRKEFDEKLVEKPKNFELMIKYANLLSKAFPASRVDFYNIDGKIVFGEITFHQGGSHDISPEMYQYEWGGLINLSSEKLVVSKKTERKYNNLLKNNYK